MTRIVSVIASVGILLAGTLAAAAIAGRGDRIDACYDPAKGGLRVIDSEKSHRAACDMGWLPLSWSQTRPAFNNRPMRDWRETGGSAGHFVSPNGKYSLEITDGGIILGGPINTVTLDANGLTVRGSEDHFGEENHWGHEQHWGQEDHWGEGRTNKPARTKT